MKEFFQTMPRNILRAFHGKNLLYHITAFVVTGIIVSSGFDWWYFVLTNHAGLDNLLFPAIVIGAFFPAIVPLLIITAGWVYKNRKLVLTGWAVGQAAVIGLIIS